MMKPAARAAASSASLMYLYSGRIEHSARLGFGIDDQRAPISVAGHQGLEDVANVADQFAVFPGITSSGSGTSKFAATRSEATCSSG